MPTASLTKPGTPKLSECARLVHAPARITSTGWPSVEAKCADLGISFRWWQAPIGRVILAKREDGTYASTIGGTGLSLPRQVGKTFLVAAIMFALCLTRPGFTVLWTAHRLKTADETFGKLQVFAKRRKILPHIQQVRTGSGDQVIIFRNGSRILFGARERGFGRGFDEVDALVFDEAQHLTDSALDDMVPATNQSRQPEGALMLFMGTPPRPQDPGEVFSRMRADAQAGDEDTGWVEFGANSDYRPTPLPAPLDDADWGQISSANPSFPDDTSRTAILRLRKKLGDDSFLREGLGIWGAASTGTVLPLDFWSSLTRPDVQMAEPVAFSLEVALGRDSACIGAAWQGTDHPHVVVAKQAAGVDWIVSYLSAACAKRRGSVTLDGATEAGSFVDKLEAEGIKVNIVKGADRPLVCSGLVDAVATSAVTHDGDPAVLSAISGATWRQTVEGARTFARKGGTDIAPLYAVALALYGVGTSFDVSRSVW